MKKKLVADIKEEGRWDKIEIEKGFTERGSYKPIWYLPLER